MNEITLSTQLALRIGNSKKVLAVASIAEASDKWCAFRDAHALGSSESPKVTVVDTATNKTVATISYNGRAWAPNGEEIL